MPRRRSYSSDRHRSSSDDSRYSRRKKKRSRSRSPIKGEYNLKREPDFKRDDSYDEYRRRDSSSSRLTVLNFLICHSSILNFGFNPGAGGGITFDAKALLSEIKKFPANFENSHYTLNPWFFILFRLVWLIFQNFNPFTLDCAIVCPLPRPFSA